MHASVVMIPNGAEHDREKRTNDSSRQGSNLSTQSRENSDRMQNLPTTAMANGIRSNVNESLEMTEQDSGGISADEACNNLQCAKITWLLEMGRCPLEWMFHWMSPRRALFGLAFACRCWTSLLNEEG